MRWDWTIQVQIISTNKYNFLYEIHLYESCPCQVPHNFLVITRIDTQKCVYIYIYNISRKTSREKKKRSLLQVLKTWWRKLIYGLLSALVVMKCYLGMQNSLSFSMLSRWLMFWQHLHVFLLKFLWFLCLHAYWCLDVHYWFSICICYRNLAS